MNESSLLHDDVPASDIAALKYSQTKPLRPSPMDAVPTLDKNCDDWTPASVAAFVDVPQRTMSRWCRVVLGDCEGKRRMTHDEAQRAVNRCFLFGYKKQMACK